MRLGRGATVSVEANIQNSVGVFRCWDICCFLLSRDCDKAKMFEVFILSSRGDAITNMFQVQTIPLIRNTVQSGDAAYYSSHPHRGDFM